MLLTSSNKSWFSLIFDLNTNIIKISENANPIPHVRTYLDSEQLLSCGHKKVSNVA